MSNRRSFIAAAAAAMSQPAPIIQPGLHNAIRAYTALQVGHQLAFGETGAWGVERISETLQPSVDLWSRPEWALLRGEELFSGAETVAAGGVGTFGKVGIFNPATNVGQIVVILRHWISLGAANDVELYPVSAVLGNTGSVNMLDRRRRISHGAVTHFEASAAAGADRLTTIILAINDVEPIELPIILPPGQGFMWRNTVAQQVIRGGFDGYQRRALPGELTLGSA